jgi:small subunit ribosomal protein S5
VLEAAGVHDILTKSKGSPNVLNVMRATFSALCSLKSPELTAKMRGKQTDEVLPFWRRKDASKA